MPPRDSFAASTKRAISNRVGHLCSHPDCGVPTKGPATNPARTINVGDAAHITAASPGGPRYDSSLTREERASPENGIWLCRIHAKLVDDDEEEYTVEKLRLWKDTAEQAARHRLERPTESAVNTTRTVAKRNVLLQQRRNESRGRCIARWKAAGLTREKAIAFADDENLGKASGSCPNRS